MVASARAPISLWTDDPIRGVIEAKRRLSEAEPNLGHEWVV